jgi:hypothetical protein
MNVSSEKWEVPFFRGGNVLFYRYTMQVTRHGFASCWHLLDDLSTQVDTLIADIDATRPCYQPLHLVLTSAAK